jgi:hypothetical protein
MARIDFMPNWKKEEDCFNQEPYFRNTIDQVTGKKNTIKGYPRQKPVLQISYEQWQKDVYDEDNQVYYSARDQKGNLIKGTDQPKYLIRSIFRLRKQGKEYLFSLGKLEGFDSLGNKKIRNCPSPEKWTKTTFGHEQRFDRLNNKMIMQVTGIIDQETVYELPFNEKNLNKLLEQREDDSVSLALKEEGSAESRGISNAGDYATQVKLFKTKDFDFLCNGDYLTPQQKEEMRKEAEARGLIPPRLYTQSQVEAGEVYREQTKTPKNTYG